MSLETLLEAAKYLEYHAQAKARGENPPDYNTFTQITAELELNSRNEEDSNNISKYSLSDDSKERRRAGGAGTREVHNKLEKNRRAHLKECFETLKRQIPSMDDKKTSNLSILRSALRYIQSLKRKEREYEHELEQLAREKIALQQRFATLKKELSSKMDVDLKPFIHDDNSNSTSTASECGPLSDDDGDIKLPLIQAQATLQLTTLATLSTVAANTQHIITTPKNCSDLPPATASSAADTATTVTLKPVVVSTTLAQQNARSLTQSVTQAMFPIATQAVNPMIVHPVQMIAPNTAAMKVTTSQLTTAKSLPVVVSKSNATFLQKPVLSSITTTGSQPTTQTLTFAQVPLKVGSTAMTGLAAVVSKNNIHPVSTSNKPVAQLLQQTIAQQAIAQQTMSVQGAQVTALIKTPSSNAAVKSMTPLRSQTIGTLSAGVTHLVTSQALLPNVNHIVASAASMMAPVTVMSAANHATQLLPTTQIGKVLAQPVIKTQIPVVQQQFLQPSRTTQSVVKPVVVVAVPNVTTTTAPSVQVSVPVTH